MNTATPLKDAWFQRISNVDKNTLTSDISKLSIGCYAAIKGPANNIYTGFVKSIGRVNVVIESPYGGWADNDFISIQDLKFRKSEVKEFYQSKK